MIEKLNKLREEAITAIKSIFTKYNIDTVDAVELDEGYSPTLDSCSNASGTVTLDRITFENGALRFEGSSSWESFDYDEDSISTDSLCDIVEYLQDHIEDIEELANQD